MKPFEPPHSPYALTEQERKGWIFGIGGFLFLPLGLLFAAVGIHWLSLLGDLIFPLMVDGDWEKFTAKNSNLYHPFWKKIILFDISTTLLIVTFGTYLFISFLLNKKFTPNLMIIWFLMMCVITGIEYSYIFDKLKEVSDFKDQILVEAKYRHAFYQSVFWALMLIPYFIFSKRVKWTFIK